MYTAAGAPRRAENIPCELDQVDACVRIAAYIYHLICKIYLIATMRLSADNGVQKRAY